MEFSFDSETLATLMAFGMPEPRAKRSMMVCESEEAMMKIASLLMGTTEEVPSYETKPAAKEKK